MSNDSSSNSTYRSLTFPRGMVDALERLHSESPSNASESVYIYDLVARQTLWSSGSIATMLGYENDDSSIIGPMGLVDLIHPDDVKLVLNHYQKFDTLQSGKVIVTEYRMRRADGTWGRLRSQETPLETAANGLPVQILGILQEVTQEISENLSACTSFDYYAHDTNQLKGLSVSH